MKKFKVYQSLVFAMSLMTSASSFAGGGELSNIQKDVRLMIFKMLDTDSLKVLSGMDRQCHTEASVELNLRYEALLNSEKPIVKLRPTDPQAQAFQGIGNGSAYRIKDPAGLVPPFTLSDVARHPDGSVHRMNHADAIKYCQDRGLRLPTENRTANRQNEVASSFELSALSRAMGNPTADWYGRASFNPDLIPGMSDNFLWSSSVHSDDDESAYVLYGCNGLVYGPPRADSSIIVRCVAERVK